MLGSDDILQAMHHGIIEISPFNPDHLGANSYDVCLGNDFYLLLSVDGEPQYFGPLHVETGRNVLLPNGGTLLGHTMEIVSAKYNVTGLMKSRSTTRRTGVSVCIDAGLGDVGYPGRWTMELSSHVQFPSLMLKTGNVPGIYKRVGERIAQISFHRTETPPRNAYSGQYNSNDFPLCMVPKEYRDSVLPWNELRSYSDVLAKLPWVK